MISLRAGKRCEYCRAPQDIIGQAFHIDHIVPLSAGGQTTADNLCFACSHCNIAKSNNTESVDTETGIVVRFFNPRIDDWQEHFCWSSNWKRLIGRTAIARTTIVALKMNDKLLQKARPFWRMAGRIP